jgi:hypothetical protein
MEEAHPPRPGLAGHEQRVVGSAVAPVRLAGELLGCVLALVDEEVDALAQLEHRVGHALEGERSLVVAHVGDRGPL